MTRLTTLNLPTFHRQFIGFDNLFDQMDRVFENSPTNGSGGYPPYNIAKLNDDEFMVSLAVAGFSMDNLEITKDKDVLKIEGKTPKGDEDVNYVHRGIAGRNFVREFTLAEHVDGSGNPTMETKQIKIIRRRSCLYRERGRRT